MDCKPPIYSLYIASEQLDTSETAAGSGLVRHPVPGGVPQEARVHQCAWDTQTSSKKPLVGNILT